MDHADALREMSVERYLLGELRGEPRASFEEHLFECQLCAADLSSGTGFLEGARSELAAAPAAAAATRQAGPVRMMEKGRARRLLSPLWLAPALAACLLAVAYETAVVVPDMRQQLAQAESPAIMNNLVLAGGATRGGSALHVAAPAHGSFLLSLDIAAQSSYSSYVCTLYSPGGAAVWHGTVTPQQANDTVLIRVPAAVTSEGENTLLVQGLRLGDASGAKLETLAKHTFLLELQK